MADAPTDDELLALLRAEVSGPEARDLLARAKADPRAAATLALLEEIRVTLREEPSLRPGPEAIARVKGLMLARRSAPTVGDRLVRAVESVARLVFDSATAPAALGFRGGAATRHLTYAAEGTELDLMIAAPRGGEGDATVTGQIDPAAPGGARIVFEPADRTGAHEARADDAGLFRLSLPPGLYRVRVELDRGVVRADAVPVEV